MIGVPFELDEDNEHAYSLDDATSVVTASQARTHPRTAQHPSHSARSLATSTSMTSIHSLPVQSPHRLQHQMAGLPPPPNPIDAADSDPSPFAWSPPGTATRATNAYHTIPSPDSYSYPHAFADLQHQYGPPPGHAPDPNAVGPSSVPTLAYTNASAYGPYGPTRRSPQSTNPSPPQQHHYGAPGPDGYAHNSSSFQNDVQSPSVSPPNPTTTFDPGAYPAYAVYPPGTLPPPPIYTSAHPRAPPPSQTVAGPASYTQSGASSPEASYHPRTSPITLGPTSRYHPYVAAEKAAQGILPTPASPTSKPYACRFCPYTSSRSHDLKRHMRTHTNERPYECEVCHRTFARKDAAKRHMAAKNCGANASGAGLGTRRADGSGPGGASTSVDGKMIDGTSSEEQSDDEDQSGEGDGSQSPVDQLQVDGVDGIDGIDHNNPMRPKTEDKTPTPPNAATYPTSSMPYASQQLQQTQQTMQSLQAGQPIVPPRSASDHGPLGRRPGAPEAAQGPASTRPRGPSYSRSS